MRNCFFNFTFFILIGAAYIWYSTHADCNVCQSNGVACINLTSFHMCFGQAEPDTSQTFSCQPGLECTDQPVICFQSGAQPASCGDVSSCGLCNSQNAFACTSRTTFAFCFGALTPSSVNGTCPEGYVCDASSPKICVEELTSESIVCNTDPRHMLN